MQAYRDICLMARRFRPAVDGIMLRRGDHAIVFGIVTLHARDKRHAHAPRQKGVFPVGFLAASPPGIAENINVRRPEIQTLEKSLCPSFIPSTYLIRAFNTGRNGHLVNDIGIKCRCQSNRLGKRSDATIVSNSVQRFAPPVVVRNIQPRNGA